MTMRDPVLIEVSDASAAGEARRAITALATELGFDEDAIGRLSVVATELATNLVKHASGGLVLATPFGAERNAIEVLALDCGPGIADIGQAMHDGHSTASTSGTGLGAITRMADFFDLYSLRAMGTVVVARVGRSEQRAGAADVAGISVPVRNEIVNGDSWG